MVHPVGAWRSNLQISKKKFTMPVKDYVITYLDSQNPIPGEGEVEKLACLYLDSGVIDSMGIVFMITEFEEKFGIRFSSDHLQSDDFQTVGGVIRIIEQLQSAAS